MARFIDADKLKQELLEEDEKLGKPKDMETMLKSTGIFHALIHIQLAETEDVTPVIHAHWVRMYNNDWLCSNCDNILDESTDLNDIRYCSWCGAKMDEEVE